MLRHKQFGDNSGRRLCNSVRSTSPLDGSAGPVEALFHASDATVSIQTRTRFETATGTGTVSNQCVLTLNYVLAQTPRQIR